MTRGTEYCSIWTVPNAVGVFNGEGPPVPIPNTEVKLCSGDNTRRATGRKDSSLPTHPERERRDIWFAVCPFNHFNESHFAHG